MAFDLRDTLVVGISATALFDLSEEDQFFKKQISENPSQAVRRYREYMLERELESLSDGTGMPLMKGLLGLNRHAEADKTPLVEVVVMSRNSPETAVRVLHNVRNLGLEVSRFAFTGGESVVEYLEAFDVDLFLTTDKDDAQAVIDGGYCPAAILKDPPSEGNSPIENQVRIAFDGDAVLFDEQSELVYKRDGLQGFHKHEDQKKDEPMAEGPYASFLKKLSRLQERLPGGVEGCEVRVAIVTARNAPAEIRVVNTLRNWGVYVDEVFFLGGVKKDKVLSAFKPHIFFDDQELHLKDAAHVVPSALVPYESDSQLRAPMMTPSEGKA